MKPDQLRSAFFLLLLGVVLTGVFFIMQPYLITLAVSGTATVIFYPVYDYMQRKLKGRKTIAALLMVLLTYVLILFPLSLIAVQVATEASGMYKTISSNTDTLPLNLLSRLEELLQSYIPISFNISQYAGNAFNWIAGNLQSLLTQTVRTVFLTLLGTFAYFYMLRDGKSLIHALVELSPLDNEEDLELIHRLHKAVNSVIRGSIVIGVLQGVVTGIGLVIFGIPSAVLLASIAAVGAMIPTIGTTIVLGPVIVYLLVIGQYVSALGLGIWGVVAVGAIDNFLYPLLVGKGMRMHPVFIFFAVIGGIAYFGISGLILGPLVISLLFGLLDIFKKETTSK